MIKILSANSYHLGALRTVMNSNLKFPSVRNKTIFIKPNLVMPPDRWDKHSITHINVIKIIIEMLQEQRCKEIIIGDCGFKNQWEKTLKLSKYSELEQKYSNLQVIGLQEGSNFHKFSLIRMKSGKYLSLYGAKLSDYMLNCDVIINVPKLKIHSMALITCCIKNMMGTMAQKGSMHPRANIRILHKRLRDFYFLLKPMVKYCLVDGIIGSEYCEQYGIPKRSNVLIFGDDMWETDCIASQIMGIDPDKVPYLRMIQDTINVKYPELIKYKIKPDEYEKSLAWRR